MNEPARANVRERAYRYHLKGLTFAEIGKLLDLSPRTVEKYSQQDGWKARTSSTTPVERASEMRKQGHSYAEIGRTLGVSRSTVSNYLSKAKKAAV